ncbi:MAG: Xaa-Pro peptidase family protein [Pseudoflavonifractor sp.]|nr:Xaa-Pro peptidase family protein [Pseudoflavonifractor sp.]
MNTLLLLTPEEHALRIGKIRKAMHGNGIDALLVSDNANIYYITGRVFSGYIYIPAKGNVLFAVRRPVGLEGDGVHYIHKPENLPAILSETSIPMPGKLGLELDLLSYENAMRLMRIFPDADCVNGSPLLREARSVKTPAEIDKIRQSGIRQVEVYHRIPRLYIEGMTDLELQIEIERASRLEGCLGQFRISGDSMELFMANVLCGDNADVPTPYDFAMGGEGIDPSLPVGCNGTTIMPGTTVMVDANGNYTGYMTDMTRVYYIGHISDLAMRAHECSIRICHELAALGQPGTEAKVLDERARAIVKEEGLEEYFMGHRQHAGFIGHGVGIEINELPVISPRSHDILKENNVVALEPKFVIPHVGAVGIENTYVVTADGMKCLTNAPEEMTSLV